MEIERATIAIIGALDAFPIRIAAREIAGKGGTYRRGVSRRTDLVVLGHRVIDTWKPERILERISKSKAAGARIISENAFLELLGLRSPIEEPRQFSRDEIVQRSNLSIETLDILLLFDVFDFPEPSLGFRGLLIAKQCAALLGDDGTKWPALIMAIRSAKIAGSQVTSLKLEWSEWKDVVARQENTIAEVSGQQLLSLNHPEEDQTDELLAEAEELEAIGDWSGAEDLYRRCLACDPNDPNIHFNLSHVLIANEDWSEARYHLNKVLKLDTSCADAWYNLSLVARKQNDLRMAKRYLESAIAIDPNYPDPIYNLALIHFDEGDHREASRLWGRYLELDPGSDWSRKAKHGLQLIQMMAASMQNDRGAQTVP